jgi:small subunit ribosomal protein S16
MTEQARWAIFDNRERALALPDRNAIVRPDGGSAEPVRVARIRGKMAVHIRLARHGTKKAAYYRIVVTDHRNARDGRFIEHIGIFDPRIGESTLKLDRERLEYWTKQGATPSATLTRLLKAKPAPVAAG